MPSPGYIQGQVIAYEQLYSSSGTIVYDLYAQIPQGSSSITGSITGAALFTSKLTEVEEFVAEEVPAAYVNAITVGKGKALGTLIGSLSGKTIVAGPNTVLIKLYTAAGTEAAAATNIVGTIVGLARGR
jgi:hypothetical protein